MNEQDRLDRFREAYPTEVHVKGRFFYEPKKKRFWHWCTKIKLVGSIRICHLNNKDILICSECRAEIQESDFPMAFQLYLKLF